MITWNDFLENFVNYKPIPFFVDIENNYIGLKKEDVNLLDIKFAKFEKKEEHYVSMPKFIESLQNDYVLIKILQKSLYLFIVNLLAFFKRLPADCHCL